MLALTYPDGARVQHCDYLPENLSISPVIVELVSPKSSLGTARYSNSRIDYAARFRTRNSRRVRVGRRGNSTGVENSSGNLNEAETPAAPASPLSQGYYTGEPIGRDKSTDNYDEGEVDTRERFRTSSQYREEVVGRYGEGFSVFKIGENRKSKSKSKSKTRTKSKSKSKTKTKTKSESDTRRRELPGRESWPGGGHPKDRCFLQLLLILVLIIIGYNRHCGPFGSRVDRTAFSVLAFGTYVGQAGCAPVDIITDTGVRSERSANLSHITGTSRKIQMYIKHRHLQILPDGTVNGSNDDTSDFTVLQRTSVSRGQLRIQGVATCLYLCMDSCGLLYGSREYTEDCVFNETLEQHNYNTYSSAHWSTPRKTLYLGLSGRGEPRRVQAKGHNLGRLSAYARVLTQVVAQDRVEALHRRMSGGRQHNVRHHHGGSSGSSSQQTVCPVTAPQEKDGRDKFRCRKRKKRKKRRRKCRAGENPGAQCDARDNNGPGNGPETQSKRSCEGAAVGEACRREALETPAKKRKSRIEEDETWNERAVGDVEELIEDDGTPDGKSRRSNVAGSKKGSKGKKTAGTKRRKNSEARGGGQKGERSVVKNLKKKGQNRGSSTPGRFARTTQPRLVASPGAVTSPLYWSSVPTSPTMLAKSSRETFDSLRLSGEKISPIFTDREKSPSTSSSSAVSAVSLAATSIASTLTLTVASGEVFADTDATHGPHPAQVQTRTDAVLDIDELAELRDFVEDDEEDEISRERDDEEDERNHGSTRDTEEDGTRLAM